LRRGDWEEEIEKGRGIYFFSPPDPISVGVGWIKFSGCGDVFWNEGNQINGCGRGFNGDFRGERLSR
jgi:hypothetical protein